jgi:PPP family 3-phenylpropionic acid transporter
VTGYGFGGVIGVLAGGATASRWGFEAMFAAAAGLGLLAMLCAQRVRRLEEAAAAPV